MNSKISRIMISACASGSGKTTVTCGILKALADRKLKVAACKCGPDYIDPMFHRSVLGIPSKNIDLFFADKAQAEELFKKHAKNSDIVVTEGVMGYYDGLSMTSDNASSYDVARALDMPVILVINAKGMALSLLAQIKGMLEFRKDSGIKGVILNNVSEMVFKAIAPEIERELNIAALGFLPHDESITIDSRHLGLVTPDNIEDLSCRLDKLGKSIAQTVDIDRLIAIAEQASELENTKDCGTVKNICGDEKIRIAVAYDEAFCFYYQDNMELLENMGCELVHFSPLRDKSVPDNIHGLLLGGGYPELYAPELSQNKGMLSAIRDLLENGLPALAECGGYMYLHKSMEDKQKKSYDMVGFLEEDSFKCDRLVRFGYITLEGIQNDYLPFGESIRAHEFHYWDSTDNGKAARAVKPAGKRSWECCHQIKETFMGYPHLFYYSNIKFAERFVQKCMDYKNKN